MAYRSGLAIRLRYNFIIETGYGPTTASKIYKSSVLTAMPKQRIMEGSIFADVAQFWQRRLTQTEVVTSSNLVVGTDCVVVRGAYLV